jgi:hypothetical protein
MTGGREIETVEVRNHWLPGALTAILLHDGCDVSRSVASGPESSQPSWLALALRHPPRFSFTYRVAHS